MRRLRSALSRLAATLRRDRWEKDLDAELQSNLELHIEDNVRAGMRQDEVRREAILRFGGLPAAKDAYRRRKTLASVEDLGRDLRYSARSLWRARGFSLVVIGTMALCIGANTTVLSALYGLILKPLPVQDPAHLVQLFNSTDHRQPAYGFSRSSWNQYEDLKARTQYFAGAGLRISETKLIARSGSSRRINCQTVSAGFFDLMGARPILGRFFLPEEHAPTPAQVMVLSQTEWESEYGADPGVLGHQVTVDKGRVYTIIGVAPRSMEVFDHQARFTLPGAPPSVIDHNYRYHHGHDLWLRLESGIGREVALKQIEQAERDWYAQVDEEESRNRNAAFRHFHFEWPHPLRGTLYLLEGGSLLVLLVGCFNVVTLLSSRVNQKRHELSVRTALGADKSSLRRQMLTEGFWLSMAAVGLGVLLTLGGVRLVNAYLNVVTPRTPPIILDSNVFGGAVLIAFIVLTSMSVLPLEILWRTGLLQRLDDTRRTSSAGSSSRRLSNSMVVGQVAIAFVLLTCAGLLLRSFQNVMAVDPGFPADQIVEARVDEGSNWLFYPQRTDANGLRQNIHAAMEDIPGVESVSFSSAEMFAGDKRGGEYLHHWVTPGFFDTMRIPILEGRDFSIADKHDTTAILDERYARRQFPDGDAIGASLPVPWAPEKDWPIVIGVVRRASFRGQEDRDGTPFVYLSGAHLTWWGYSVLVRTHRPAAEVIRDMRAVINEIDPRLVVSYARPLDQALDEMLMGRKALTLLLLSFAGLAVFLSAFGIYGLLAYDVEQRRREIGIRSAIGASRGSILRLILQQGLRKAALGLAIGLLGSFYLTRFLEARLFDVTTRDPMTYLGGIGFLLLVTFTASAIPAHRAVRVDPTEAIKTS